MDSRRHRADNSISDQPAASTPHHDNTARLDDLDPAPNLRSDQTDAPKPNAEPHDRPPPPGPADEQSVPDHHREPDHHTEPDHHREPDQREERQETDRHSPDRAAESPSTDAQSDPFVSYPPELRAHLHHDDTLSRLQYLSNPLPEPDRTSKGEPGQEAADETDDVVKDSAAPARPEPSSADTPPGAADNAKHTSTDPAEAATPADTGQDSTTKSDDADGGPDSGKRTRVGASETEEHAVADEEAAGPRRDDSFEAATVAEASTTKSVADSDAALETSDRLSSDGYQAREGNDDQLGEPDVPATTADRARHWHELGYDPAVGKFRQGEAETAVRIESERDVRLERARIDQSYDWIDSHGRTYDAVGNFSARYLDLQWDHFKAKVEHHLEKADYVPIDVAKFTPEQRERIRDTFDAYYPRVFIVGDEGSDGRND